MSAALLEAVARHERPPVLRSYRPLPTVAFGRRDTFLPGFAAAADAARRHGYVPVIRAPGGRAAAYDQGCLVIEEIVPSEDAMAGMHERFALDAERHAAGLRALGVDARVGEVPGEYCPGTFSVNAGGARKLIGAAQRVIRGGWLLATVVVVQDVARLRGVLEAVYTALELEWDPGTAGAVADEVPGLGVHDVERALLDVYAERYRLVAGTLPSDAAARERLARHVPASG